MENISAKMKELEKAGVNLLCVASTGTTLTHYVAGEVDKIIFKPLGARLREGHGGDARDVECEEADYGSSFDGQGREWR